ncbi:MAG: glycosyltransferase [Saprospiraceae bacterium]
MELSVIIVNYNVRYFLEQALQSVQRAAAALPPGEVEVFVVDNNSVDNSVAMVREKFPEVKLIENQQNTGFSTANNQAIRQAAGRYVLLLNPDTVVREDTFVKCIQFMDAHPDAGALGVRMIDGSGKFLPESKRGFPAPFVAFCKTFGLSRLFPKSKLFNRYHLGFLDEHETNEVDVLAGAFMFIRKSVLDEIGLLDEAFFMYGEDIDLSYRIVQAGYKNYYFPETTIIHYKGESTKKGSLNYVRTFYNAMLIFARKHFSGRQARLFIAMIYAAVYFRAALALVSGFFRRWSFFLADAALISGGLVLLKNFWANYYYHDPNYYPDSFLYINVPVYTMFWLGAVFFNGGYDEPFNLRRLIRGLLTGTVLLLAVYGLLPLELRPSRAILLMGAIWAVAATTALRTFLHFARSGNFRVGRTRPSNLIIVGSEKESERVRQLLALAQVPKNYIGTVAPGKDYDPAKSLAGIERLNEVVNIFKVDEVIFCAADISSDSIMQWMTRLGPSVHYKIVPKESLSIIGSHSKDSAGELYTIEISYRIASPVSRRNKRMLDLLLLPLVPFFFLFAKRKGALLRNSLQILTGKKSWVGYATGNPAQSANRFPSIKPGLLSPADALTLPVKDEHTLRHLDFLYAKDYDVWQDLEIVWKGWRKL